jgi:hypothetical protein
MKRLILILALASLACGQAAMATAMEPAVTPVTAVESYAGDEVPTPSRSWTVCAWTLNVRAAPSTSAMVYDDEALERGQVVAVREWSRNGNGWAMIAPGRWVNGDYLSRDGCDGR